MSFRAFVSSSAWATHMRLAQGGQESSTVAAFAAIDRFENSTGYRSFKAFHVEQAKAFREKILTQPGARGQETLSAATMTSTLRNLRAFLPGLRNGLDIGRGSAFLTPSTSIRRSHMRGSLALVGSRAFRPSISSKRWSQR
jgi:hypothetical protein